MRAVIALSSLSMLFACIEQVPGGGSPGQMTVALDDYAAWDRISTRPYDSAIGAFTIMVRASDGANEYRAIHPERSGTNATMPVGAVIAREVLDERGAVTKITLMAKGPPGYDPRIGDWWFGVTDPLGIPLIADGTPQLGKLEACHGCHIPRAHDDYLFGVPAIDEEPL